MTLNDDLAKAEKANYKGCQMCDAIAAEPDDGTRVALTRAAAGSIGRDKLVRIMHQNGLKVGRRALERHRMEGHLS